MTDRSCFIFFLSQFFPLVSYFRVTACAGQNCYMLRNILIIFGRFVDKVFEVFLSKGSYQPAHRCNRMGGFVVQINSTGHHGFDL